MSPFEIRRLGADDASLFREIRLEGLRYHPEAFGASFEEEADQTEMQWQARLQASTVLGGFRAGGVEGVAAVARHRAAKVQHIAFIWGMYVRPQARGTGLSRLLITRAIDQVKGTCRSIRLSVVSSNMSAIRLYESVGFKAWAIDAEALNVGSIYHDEVLMRLDIEAM